MQSENKRSRTNPNHRVTPLAIRCAVALAITIFVAISGTRANAQFEPSTTPFFVDEAPRRFYASAGVGFDFSRGDYGDPVTTNSLAIPFSLMLELEPITFRLSLPYSVADGFEKNLSDGNGSEAGDVTTSFTYTYYPSAKALPVLDLTTKVKIPTANDKLGTGKTDVTLQLELSKSLGRLSGFGSFGYRFKEGFYRDIVLASLGAGFRVSRSFSMGVAYDYREASVRWSKDSHEISPNLSIRSGEHLRFGPYGVVGLSEPAPTWGLGANVTWIY
ncbi:MAG TPA: hypothetical protein EYG46_15190 [Myxococcales bacterium]|nr:hypothetical protein [Myxococcales bacterium]HIM02324.1 hypothetical protein [Myxococcales bacterium]